MWKCANCGNENHDEFEICMYCGSVRRKAEPKAAELFARITAKLKSLSLRGLPARLKSIDFAGIFAKLKGFVTGAFRGGKLKWPLFAGTGVLLVLLVLMTVSLSFHGKANKSYEGHNYHKALEYAEKDFLFGGGMRNKAYLALAEGCMADGEYAEAIGYYEAAGEDGLEGRSEAIYALGEQQLAEGDYAGALESFTLIEDEERGLQAKNNALYACALLAAMKGDSAAAEDYIAQMTDSYAQSPLVLDLFKEADFLNGRQCLLAGEYKTAVSYFENCRGYGDADKTCEAARRIYQKRYYEAARVARDYCGSGSGQITAEHWRLVFENARTHCPDSDINALVGINCALAVFGGNRQGIYSGWDLYEIMEMFPTEHMPSGMERSLTKQVYTPISQETIQTCGSEAEQGIMILWQVNNRGIGDKEYAVAWDLMELLPEELYPRDLKSTEFIVRINYSYQAEGQYAVPNVGNVPALTEYCKVSAERAANSKILYFETVMAPDAPDSIYTTDIYDGYVSGGSPDTYEVAESFYEALRTLINVINDK